MLSCVHNTRLLHDFNFHFQLPVRLRASCAHHSSQLNRQLKIKNQAVEDKKKLLKIKSHCNRLLVFAIARPDT